MQGLSEPDVAGLLDRLVATGAFENVGYEYKPSASGSGYDAVLQVIEVAQLFAYHLEDLPVTDEDAHQLVRSLRGSQLLFGYRGAPAVDVGALEDVILRVGLFLPPRFCNLSFAPLAVFETANLILKDHFYDLHVVSVSGGESVAALPLALVVSVAALLVPVEESDVSSVPLFQSLFQ